MGHNIAIGPDTGNNMFTAENCVLIGRNTGYKIVGEKQVVIIGDNIANTDPNENKHCIFMGVNDQVVIGRWLFRLPNPIYYYIKWYLWRHKEVQQ